MRAEAEREELLPGDHPVLSLRQIPRSPIPLFDFPGHNRGK
jgi:hypothetical protein